MNMIIKRMMIKKVMVKLDVIELIMIIVRAMLELRGVKR